MVSVYGPNRRLYGLLLVWGWIETAQPMSLDGLCLGRLDVVASSPASLLAPFFAFYVPLHILYCNANDYCFSQTKGMIMIL